jgi:hypothetical protein
MMIIAAKDVHCPTCGAEPGETCTFRYHAGGKKGRKFRYGSHSSRCHDADAGQRMANTLLDS